MGEMVVPEIAAVLDALPRYSVICDNTTEQTWIAVGREWPQDTWLWLRTGDGTGPKVASSAELTGYDLVLLAQGLTEPRSLVLPDSGS